MLYRNKVRLAIPRVRQIDASMSSLIRAVEHNGEAAADYGIAFVHVS